MEFDTLFQNLLQNKIAKKSLNIQMYQSGNQNLYMKEEQKIQWPKEKVQKDKQQSTIHVHIKLKIE